MGVSCIVDPIAGKIGLVSEQNVTNHMGIRVNPMAQFQPATHVRRFKMLNTLNVVWIHSFCNNPYGKVESNYQHLFAINIWCGVNGDQIIGPYIYVNFLQHELPAFLENVPLQTRWQMYYQHDGAPPHFSQVIRQYWNHKFPNQWIGHGRTQNWPPWSPDLNPLDYHVRGYMKAMVSACKVNTRVKLPANSQRCNNTAVLHKITSSLVTQVRKCIQTDGGHFEQLA